MIYKIGDLIFILTFLTELLLAKATDETQAFLDHQVVPDVVAIQPEKLLKVTYNDGLEVHLGNELTPTQVQKEPKVEWEADSSSFYTLLMVDPDAPSRSNPEWREFKHWIVVNIPGDDVEQGTVLAAYIGSGPPKDTGLHRYVFLLYKQPQKLGFNEKHVGNNSAEGRPKFKASEFVKKHHLGEPIAGNFFQAQYDEYVPILNAQLSGN